MLIIADSSPLISFAILNQLTLLENLFSEIIVPKTVFDEITETGKPYSDVLKQWSSRYIKKAKNLDALNAFKLILGSGEAESIVLYKELKANLLVIDDKKGRKIAQLQDVKTIGTIGILILAKRKNLIVRIKPLLQELVSKGIRISPELIIKALELSNES